MQEDSLSDEDALQLLEELQLNQSERIHAARPDQGVQHVSACVIRPGNQSSRAEVSLTGRTLMVAPRQVTVMLRAPVLVGDLYFVEFDRQKLDADGRIFRCSACRETGDRFEAALEAYEPIDLKSALVG